MRFYVCILVYQSYSFVFQLNFNFAKLQTILLKHKVKNTWHFLEIIFHQTGSFAIRNCCQRYNEHTEFLSPLFQCSIEFSQMRRILSQFGFYLFIGKFSVIWLWFRFCFCLMNWDRAQMFQMNWLINSFQSLSLSIVFYIQVFQWYQSECLALKEKLTKKN